MKASELRQSILQAAVQGKLVPQNLHDEPASVLLERIRAEKAKLIKEGKIKKENPLMPVEDDEIPYDLPEGWAWCRLGEAAIHSLGKMLDNQKNEGIYQEYLRNKNVQWFSFDLTDMKKMRIKESEHERYEVCKGDLIICEGGYPGTSAIWDKDYTVYYQKALHRVRFPHEKMNIYFQYYLFLISQSGDIEKYVTGAGIQHLTSRALNTMIYPLPPLAEQQRIVAKVDELMAMCDKLETAEDELETLENHFIETLPKSILQMAVQGKLVPQDLHDKPATELLARIRTEKAKLIKEGTLKKEKTLPPIAEDEIPYDLPEGWVLCRLGEVCFLLDGNKQSGVSLPYLEAKTLRGTKEPVIKESGKFISRGTKLILVDGENSGEIFTPQLDGYMGSTFKVLHIVQTLYVPYILFFILLQKDMLRDSKKGAAIPHLNKELFFNLLLPIPPIAEQQRIVAKVDELMNLCDELKTAKNAHIKTIETKVIPFPQITESEEEIGIAARGNMQDLSDEAKKDIDELFGDDGNA